MDLAPLPQWYWQDDSNPPRWVPYDQQQSAQLELAYQQGSTEAIIYNGKYRVLFHARKQMNSHSSFSRPILRGTWFWRGDGASMVPYPENVCQALENAFNAGQFHHFQIQVDAQRFVTLSPDGRHAQFRFDAPGRNGRPVQRGFNGQLVPRGRMEVVATRQETMVMAQPVAQGLPVQSTFPPVAQGLPMATSQPNFGGGSPFGSSPYGAPPTNPQFGGPQQPPPYSQPSNPAFNLPPNANMPQFRSDPGHPGGVSPQQDFNRTSSFDGIGQANSQQYLSSPDLHQRRLSVGLYDLPGQSPPQQPPQHQRRLSTGPPTGFPPGQQSPAPHSPYMSNSPQVQHSTNGPSAMNPTARGYPGGFPASTSYPGRSDSPSFTSSHGSGGYPPLPSSYSPQSTQTPQGFPPSAHVSQPSQGDYQASGPQSSQGYPPSSGSHTSQAYPPSNSQLSQGFSPSSGGHPQSFPPNSGSQSTQGYPQQPSGFPPSTTMSSGGYPPAQPSQGPTSTYMPPQSTPSSSTDSVPTGYPPGYPPQ